MSISCYANLFSFQNNENLYIKILSFIYPRMLLQWIITCAKDCLPRLRNDKTLHRFCTGNFHLRNLSVMSSMHLVFVYGTLKTGEPNHDVIDSLQNDHYHLIGKAQTTKNWPLVIASRYNIPFLLYAHDKGHKVIGELYEVDNLALERMDELECHPTYYEREKETVQLLESTNETDFEKGKVLTAWIYFLKDYKAFMLELPFLEEYSSLGSHGLQYVSSEDTSNPEDVYK